MGKGQKVLIYLFHGFPPSLAQGESDLILLLPPSLPLGQEYPFFLPFPSSSFLCPFLLLPLQDSPLLVFLSRESIHLGSPKDIFKRGERKEGGRKGGRERKPPTHLIRASLPFWPLSTTPIQRSPTYKEGPSSFPLPLLSSLGGRWLRPEKYGFRKGRVGRKKEGEGETFRCYKESGEPAAVTRHRAIHTHPGKRSRENEGCREEF